MKKTVLLIGSSGGLGTALTRFLMDKGFNLALHHHTNLPSREFDNLNFYQADITKEEEVKKMIDQVRNDFGRIDAVINNAGISISEISWKTSAENWQRTLDVNLTGPFFVAKHCSQIMREQNSGSIIFISSIVGETGFVGTSAYAASKAGILGLTKTMAKELATKNVRVNAIALGYFNTGMINDVSAEMQQELIRQIPVGELGDPEQLGALIEFLISSESTYLTGQTLNLNGGLYV